MDLNKISTYYLHSFEVEIVLVCINMNQCALLFIRVRKCLCVWSCSEAPARYSRRNSKFKVCVRGLQRCHPPISQPQTDASSGWMGRSTPSPSPQPSPAALPEKHRGRPKVSRCI